MTDPVSGKAYYLIEMAVGLDHRFLTESISGTVEYFNEQKLSESEVRVKGGLFEFVSSGAPVNCDVCSFVITRDFRIYVVPDALSAEDAAQSTGHAMTFGVSPGGSSTKRHTSASHGKGVVFPGGVKIVKGKLVMLSNSSGHYIPSAPLLRSAIKIFTDLGVNMTDVVIKLFGIEAVGVHAERSLNGFLDEFKIDSKVLSDLREQNLFFHLTKISSSGSELPQELIDEALASSSLRIVLLALRNMTPDQLPEGRLQFTLTHSKPTVNAAFFSFAKDSNVSEALLRQAFSRALAVGSHPDTLREALMNLDLINHNLVIWKSIEQLLLKSMESMDLYEFNLLFGSLSQLTYNPLKLSTYKNLLDHMHSRILFGHEHSSLVASQLSSRVYDVLLRMQIYQRTPEEQNEYNTLLEQFNSFVYNVNNRPEVFYPTKKIQSPKFGSFGLKCRSVLRKNFAPL